jgi:hypothetical protein
METHRHTHTHIQIYTHTHTQKHKHAQNMQYLLFVQCDNIYTNVPRFHLIFALPVLCLFSANEAGIVLTSAVRNVFSYKSDEINVN